MRGQADEKRPTFVGLRSASTTSAWNFSALRAPTVFPPLNLHMPIPSRAISNTKDSLEFTTMPSSKVKELDNEALDDVPTNVSTLLDDIDILRIYVALDEMPFALLDGLIGQLQDNGHLKQLQMCVQLLLHAEFPLPLSPLFRSLGRPHLRPFSPSQSLTCARRSRERTCLV